MPGKPRRQVERIGVAFRGDLADGMGDEGMRITLYRCESGAPRGRRTDFDAGDWKHQGMLDSGAWDAMGRWFVADQDMLDFYARDAGEAGFRVVSVEVDAARAAGWRVDVQPATVARFSRDAGNEYFVPREVAEAAIVDEAATQRLAAGVAAPSRMGR